MNPPLFIERIFVSAEPGVHLGNTNLVLPPIDILFPTHDHIEITIPAIDALYAHTRTQFHLIVLDSSSDGITPEYFKRLQEKHDNITFIHRDVFKSGNEFFNVGLEHCRHEYVATHTNSCRVEPDWEVVALQLLQNDPKIGTIGLKSLFPNGVIEGAGIQMVGYTPTDYGMGEPGHRHNDVREMPAVQWACALHRKVALVGNLSEDVFNGHVGWDDIDNNFVLRNKGWRILYCGLGAYYHLTRATRGDASEEAFKKNQENGHAFYKRWGYWDAFVKATGYKEPVPA